MNVVVIIRLSPRAMVVSANATHTDTVLSESGFPRTQSIIQIAQHGTQVSVRLYSGFMRVHWDCARYSSRHARYIPTQTLALKSLLWRYVSSPIRISLSLNYRY
jgi:hypothetical protein